MKLPKKPNDFKRHTFPSEKGLIRAWLVTLIGVAVVYAYAWYVL